MGVKEFNFSAMTLQRSVQPTAPVVTEHPY